MGDKNIFVFCLPSSLPINDDLISTPRWENNSSISSPSRWHLKKKIKIASAMHQLSLILDLKKKRQPKKKKKRHSYELSNTKSFHNFIVQDSVWAAGRLPAQQVNTFACKTRVKKAFPFANLIHSGSSKCQLGSGSLIVMFNHWKLLDSA